jgi:glycosyltransferase involved in cell wall biosynthesis
MASIRSQEYRNVEHIIVDGASTDDTVQIIKKLEGKYSVRWISEADKSPTEAVNKGLRLAKGDIVSLLPADCFYFPWTALTVVKGFRDSPKADVVYGDIAVWNLKSKYGILDFAPLEKKLDQTFRFNCPPAPSVFFDRNVMNSLGPFSETFAIVSDWEYFVRAWRKFRFHKVNEVLTGRRRDGDSVQTRRGKRELDDARQRVKARYFQNSNFADELLFSLRYAMNAAEENIALLANSFSRQRQSARWGRLIDCNGVSRTRLILTVLSTWALYTRIRYEENLRIGYLDVRRLSELCFRTDSPIRAEEGSGDSRN